MSKTTSKLGLFEYDPSTDGAQTFNITKALNENWEKLDGLTPEQIGAAPAGYGLGDSFTIIDSWDNAKSNGFYLSKGQSVDGDYMHGVVFSNSENLVTQIAYGRNSSSRRLYTRTLYNGAWSAWQTLATSTDLAGKSDVGHTHTGDQIAPMCIEIGAGASGHGGYIDFHYNSSSDDYTSRIIESASGKINIQANVQVSDQAVGVDCVRNISSGTRDLTAGSSGCGTGKIYLVYE